MNIEITRRVRDTSNLLLCHDAFCLPSPHGDHTVLVLPLRCPSLASYLEEIPISTRMSAARQLLQALKCLHDGGIVHRGV